MQDLFCIFLYFFCIFFFCPLLAQDRFHFFQRFLQFYDPFVPLGIAITPIPKPGTPHMSFSHTESPGFFTGYAGKTICFLILQGFYPFYPFPLYLRLLVLFIFMTDDHFMNGISHG